jgi:2-polyprenyl-6-hydroxyphenyl methylase / 3-demethylubiquinone-9 3-methyltransferase
VLDVGCGGGLLSEALASAGADVTAIDLAPGVLDVARLHLLETGITVDYREIAVETLAEQQPAAFDVITCMEMLEHVPDPDSIVAACARLLRPGGALFVSTLNRTPKAFALAIVGAEYVMRLLPRGTHDYAKFIRPSELARSLRGHGLELADVRGLDYNPFSRRATLVDSVDVNYLVHARKSQ